MTVVQLNCFFKSVCCILYSFRGSPCTAINHKGYICVAQCPLCNQSYVSIKSEFLICLVNVISAFCLPALEVIAFTARCSGGCVAAEEVALGVSGHICNNVITGVSIVCYSVNIDITVHVPSRTLVGIACSAGTSVQSTPAIDIVQCNLVCYCTADAVKFIIQSEAVFVKQDSRFCYTFCSFYLCTFFDFTKGDVIFFIVLVCTIFIPLNLFVVYSYITFIAFQLCAIVHVTTIDINGIAGCVSVCEGDGSSDSSFSCICKRNCSYQILPIQLNIHCHGICGCIGYDVIGRRSFCYGIAIIYTIFGRCAVFDSIRNIEYQLLAVIKDEGSSRNIFAYCSCACVCFIRIGIIGNADCKFARIIIGELICTCQSFLESCSAVLVLVQVNFDNI